MLIGCAGKALVFEWISPATEEKELQLFSER
jgi:hypothetical protein